MDFVSLSKILPLLIYPFSLGLWLMIIALLLLWFRRIRLAGVCIALGIAVLLVSGNPTLASALYAHRERIHLPLPLADYPQVDAIVALGGALGPPLPPRLRADLSGATDRLLHATRLFHAGKAPLIVLSGGNVFPQPGMEGESYYASKLIQEWGVPRSAIVVEDRSRNTYENAIFTKKLVEEMDIKKVLLVTSALHMPRALATFTSNGIDAIPSPTDYNIVRTNNPGVLDWIPNIGAISATTAVIKENLGVLAYRYKGWIKAAAAGRE